MEPTGQSSCSFQALISQAAVTCDTQPDSRRCWRYGLGSQHYKSTLILLSPPQPSLLEIPGYYATWEGEIKGGRSERVSHWKGKGWLKSLITLCPPPPPHTSPELSSQLHPQHRNTTSTCREDGDSSLQTESTGLSPDTCLYREQGPQTSLASAGQPKVRVKPNSYEILSSLCFHWQEGKNRLSLKFRFSYITAHSRQK